MYEINGICYAGKSEKEIEITAAKVLQGGKMLITFDTGEKRVFDTSALRGGAFSPLKDENILRNFTIFHGILTWADGEIDIAPETVYYESVAYEDSHE